MAYVIPAPIQATLPVVGSDDQFPIHRIYCVGRNYAAHSREMGGDPDREEPFFFMKSADTVLPGGGDFPYPAKSNDVHHEMELVVALKSGGDNIPQDQALDCIFGYGAGLDMTRRDLQGQMKKAGRPWEIGKAFENSAPCSALNPASSIGHPGNGRIWLEVNGEVRQDGDLNQLIWNVAESISYLSGLFTLAAGDLIFTGTPAGVGPVDRGDKLHGTIEGVGEINITVV
ncbi:MAG: fumarylacetoacetate hydrolase family protein [Alphaproteobacteria bacterium]|jgi:fumarylpyruvate hydrolase|nr:fumarylacetoacetate hydrolase family protein [Alphaproteobacteria bacterium]MBT4017197.1 fumarylacetoacetate hydrolase family protein [Alphaproteobacteria bacterium]MBT4966284.1 fumarylacetoacetate hydrolase family protein [Alphaproteobacteria bacterium]MBT5159155.1 fumarylacetoacetate hydrolase family protein [Alphaproteobacteria bacterium]MBT6388014.1 fumarylacetoacetate hydrolase family protein [Alphaproteobacteria bacterium]